MDRQKLYYEIRELLKKNIPNILPLLSNQALNELESIMKKAGTDVFDVSKEFGKLSPKTQSEILKIYSNEQRKIIFRN